MANPCQGVPRREWSINAIDWLIEYGKADQFLFSDSWSTEKMVGWNATWKTCSHPGPHISSGFRASTVLGVASSLLPPHRWVLTFTLYLTPTTVPHSYHCTLPHLNAPFLLISLHPTSSHCTVVLPLTSSHCTSIHYAIFHCTILYFILLYFTKSCLTPFHTTPHPIVPLTYSSTPKFSYYLCFHFTSSLINKVHHSISTLFLHWLMGVANPLKINVIKWKYCNVKLIITLQ